MNVSFSFCRSADGFYHFHDSFQFRFRIIFDFNSAFIFVFIFAMLDYTNTGFVLNCIHSREGCYIYMKEVDRGQTDVVLGNEEQEALEQALGYVEKKPE